ncbi:MAG: site-specific integrase, partial [Salinibacter sp.]
MDNNSNVEASEDPPNEDGDPRSTANELRKLASPPLSESEKVGGDTGSGPDVGSDGASQSEALGDRERLRELQESLGRLEEFAASAQAENTTRAYAADLEDFRHWCKRMDREWLPAGPETIGLYLGARADELSLATLERRLAAIASVHKEEGYESPASVAEGPLRKIWKGIVREKTRQQDSAPPLLAEDLKSIIEHL